MSVHTHIYIDIYIYTILYYIILYYICLSLGYFNGWWSPHFFEAGSKAPATGWWGWVCRVCSSQGWSHEIPWYPMKFHDIPWFMRRCTFQHLIQWWVLAEPRAESFPSSWGLADASQGMLISEDAHSGKHTKSYWTWPFIVDLPIRKCDVPLFSVCLPGDRTTAETHGSPQSWWCSCVPQKLRMENAAGFWFESFARKESLQEVIHACAFPPYLCTNILPIWVCFRNP